MIDLIEVWPRHLDYPLNRQWLHDYRDKFNKVIVVFTDMSVDEDYRPFLHEQMSKDNILAINSVTPPGEDWRNAAVNNGLARSSSEWVYFTEEDFFPLPGFWDSVELLSKSFDVFGYYQGDRLHPCCIFIKRSLLEKTTKNFGIVTDKLDHFGLLQQELEEKKIPIGAINPMLGYHLNGLSQNMYLLKIGLDPNYQEDEFKNYLRQCLDCEVLLEPRFTELVQNYLYKDVN